MNPIRISTFLGENNRLPAQTLHTENGAFMRHIVNADRAHIAGTSCEIAYDSLRGK